MGSIFAVRVAALLAFHAAGAGLAAPTVLVTRPMSRVPVEWLPTDNQTVYRLEEGESRSLELNTSSISRSVVFITISPCSRDFHWALYLGKHGDSNGQLSLQMENGSGEMSTLSLNITQHDKYVLMLSTMQGGAAVVSVRGEATRQVRIRLRVRPRRRLAANWEPSPIDPQSTKYCVVASPRKNYTSLCSAQHDLKFARLENKSNQLNQGNGRLKPGTNATRTASSEVDNQIDVEGDTFNVYEGSFDNVVRRKKFGRSTKVTDEDPVIACVGGRTHHMIENLDPSTTYFVSVFGVAKDRRSGSLLATGKVRPRTSTAKRLKENVSSKADIRGKTVFYFKATINSGGGLWLTLSTCGGAVDVEVLVRGKRLYMEKNIDPHSKFFVPAPIISSSSIQETSDESSVQFDSSSEETRMRYVIKLVPSRWDRDSAVGVELTASTTRWGLSTPELFGDGANVRELRPMRSCRSVDVAFLPATHNATDVIRYCIAAREILSGDHYSCSLTKRRIVKTQCIDQAPKSATVIVQKIAGLRAGRKYAIQVTAASKGNSVPYNVLYVDTNVSCSKEE